MALSPNSKAIILGNVLGSTFTANLPSIGGTWSLSSYNLTDNAYIGSSQNFIANTWYGPSCMIELSSTKFGFTGGKFYTICTPYAS